MATDKVEKKKGLFSSFASVFVEQVPATLESAPMPSPNTIQTPNTSVPSGQLDTDILNKIYKVLEENNLAGYDYFEFRAAIENMKAVIPDEANRFKAAFAAVSSIVSAEKLTTSATFYLQKLEEHKSNFEKFSESMVQEKVVSKEAKAKSVEQTIADKTAKIAELNKDIGVLQNDRMALLTESATEKVKIEAIKMNFTTAFNKIVDEIKADVTKISSYLTK